MLLSADDINIHYCNLSEDTLNILQESFISNSFVNLFKKNSKNQEEFLKKNNVNLDRHKPIIEKKAKATARKLKTVKDPEKISISVMQCIKDIFAEVNIGDLPQSILLVYAVSIANTAAFTIFATIFGSGIIGMALCATFVATITEEFAKSLSIKYGFSGTFFITFNIMEAMSYIAKIMAMGYSFVTALGIRVLPVLMHLATTVTQKYIIANAEIKGMDEKKAEKIAFFAGATMHGIWNGLASIGAVLEEVAKASAK